LLHAEGQIDGQTDRHGEVNVHTPKFCETRLKICNIHENY